MDVEVGSALLRDGCAVRDDFLSAAQTAALIQCAQTRRERGEFAPAQVGAGGQRRRRSDLRGDSTCWIVEPLFEAERALLADFETLRLGLNREGFLGLLDLELHYAHYPAGSGYARHVDQLHGCGQRRISLALYLNSDWQPGFGGELRLFDPQGHRDIEPLGGRLVCFATEEREHTVLTTHRERWSVSGWFRSRV